MPFLKVQRCILFLVGMGLMLSGCFRPPYNDFENDHRALKGVAVGAGVGAGLGALAGSLAGGNALAGAAIGGAAGSVVGLVHHGHRKLLAELAKQDIQYVVYGDTHVLIIPTDRYFEFNSHRLSERCYEGLENVSRLVRIYKCNPIYVAGFTDDIGSTEHKNKLTQSRADAIVTFLWAKGVQAQRLYAEGYGDQFSIGDNHLIHGSAFNRRIEIQWINKSICPEQVETIDAKASMKD